jgi:hypothetical protein
MPQLNKSFSNLLLKKITTTSGHTFRGAMRTPKDLSFRAQRGICFFRRFFRSLIRRCRKVRRLNPPSGADGQQSRKHPEASQISFQPRSISSGKTFFGSSKSFPMHSLEDLDIFDRESIA